MSNRTMLAVIIALMLAVVAGALSYQSRHPREIIGTSTIMVTRQAAGPSMGQRQTLAVRRVRIASTTFEEVELPNGTWIGCEADCRAAVAGALDTFWDDQDKRRK